MNATLMTRNIKIRRGWAHSNHRTGVKRWALARSVFMFSWREALRGYVSIEQSNGVLRHYYLEN